MKFKVVGTQVTLAINDHPDCFKSHSLLCRQGFEFSARSDGDVGDIDGAFWETNGVGVGPDVQLAVVFYHDLVDSNQRSVQLCPHISHGYSARDFQSAVSVFDKKNPLICEYAISYTVSLSLALQIYYIKIHLKNTKDNSDYQREYAL